MQVVFLPQSHPSVHTPVIKVRRANKPGRLPDMPGPLPTCWVQKTPLNLSISLAQRVSPALHGFCVLVKAQRLERGLEANSFLITTHHRPCQRKGLLMLPVETTVTSHFYLATGILFLPISSQQWPCLFMFYRVTTPSQLGRACVLLRCMPSVWIFMHGERVLPAVWRFMGCIF